MPAPAFTLDEIRKMEPCDHAFERVSGLLPKRRKITASMARDAGVAFNYIVWVTARAVKQDTDIERRMRMWLADCAARVLHIYESLETSDAPRKAIIAARAYARGEIDDAAWAARDADRAAYRAAAWAASAAARSAARSAALVAESAAAWNAAWDARDARAASAAARSAAWDAESAAERRWQFDRLIHWLSDNEPEPLPLPDTNGR